MSKSSELRSERPVESSSHSGKRSLADKALAGIDKLGGPLNRFSNQLGCEAWWPTGLAEECNKATRILTSFCKNECYTEQLVTPGSQRPEGKPTVVVKIPTEVLQRCVGLAIFTTMRSGLWMSGAGGSGVVVARKENGDWSPPSGIHVQTLGFGFMAGIDIYDCVAVINTREALKAFSKFRFTLGGELSAVAGPLGVGGLLEIEVTQATKPIFTYMKSRGVYCGIQLDTTIIIERNNENARFYGEKIPVDEIFAGRVKNIPFEAMMLMEALRRAEGAIIC
ncbi:hypothetical protein IWW34DRAFT_855216 [Fusarium oxysporum f. sp. albedinis]|nr:hypothetical protein IWW34DRAFT_855216 [Fusarium oxysporum f. sp. albedinis]KAK2471358.1 hypothetical protein H9L39_17589 [Fusarium oxysporum f. sp. albedinis]